MHRVPQMTPLFRYLNETAEGYAGNEFYAKRITRQSRIKLNVHMEKGFNGLDGVF